jgi:signal transduction histidine kinase
LSGEQSRVLAEEQAALRRVATLVARGVPPEEVFAAVTEEVGRLLGVDLAGMVRYEADDAVSLAATWAGGGERLEVGRRWSLEGDRLATSIAATARPAREDAWADVRGPIADYVRDELGVRSSVGSPIVVEGRVWGALLAHSRQAEALPADTESRLMNFTELVATAVSNAQARAEAQRLADEQAALRRVAPLVAHESPPEEVFAAVAEEVGRLLRIETTAMFRYDDDGTATVVATWGEATFPVGARSTLEGENITGFVLRTGRPARIDDFANATGSIAAGARALGSRSAVGCPIVVEGRVWGAMVTPSQHAEPLPPDTESRIAEFTELVATAISNIQARSDLAASRARIVAATDEEHRRVVRDLHDGAQQRLVHTIITLKSARSALQNEDERAPALMEEALEQAQRAHDELRELAHGILPAALARGGLRAGVDALAARMPVPIDNGVSVGRLPDAVEATAYFVVAEALTNVAKHARAERAAVTAHIEDGTLRLEVRDDGVGGVRPEGSGLVGLADRVAALDGRLRVESPADGGTLVAAAIPLPGALAEVRN